MLRERLRLLLAEARREMLDFAEAVKQSTLREIQLDKRLGRLSERERKMFSRELQSIEDQEQFERERGSQRGSDRNKFSRHLQLPIYR
jgi:hypothetical protein